MLFMYIHTHTVEHCIVEKPQESMKLANRLQEEFKKADIKSTATYLAAHQHTMYFVLEANDILALEKALTPMTAWGNGQLIPITTMQQWMPK